MAQDRWQTIEEIFLRALDAPLEERPAVLDDACGGDERLRAEVEAMLEAEDSGGKWLMLRRHEEDQASGSGTFGNPDRPLGTLDEGTRIGAYAVDELIGRGGMGDVYRAHRADDQYEQRVAIKLIRPGRSPGELIRRLRTERQILARLQHPNVATLLDGGLTEGGQPYLVMQFVDGATITDYVDEHALGLRERLTLFLDVCEAVRYAHANLVVHRDLKPTNVLVTGEGEVRLLDFGIAKILDPEAVGDATQDLLVLTPDYAAPEQFKRETITTATDVYGLGVLLYGLLTGRRPFGPGLPHEVTRAVLEDSPAAPSEVASDTAPVPARLLRGDLDAIVMKALRKEPERRYASAAELADDLRRYLDDRPVAARPDTMSYVVGRYVRRHRSGVVAAGLVAASLVALTVVALNSAATSREQARAIALERDVATEVSGFVEELFASPDPMAVGPERRDTLRIRDFLDEGASKVRTELADRPAMRARLLGVLGRAQNSLGRLDEARDLLDEALEVAEAAPDVPAPDRAEIEASLADVLVAVGEPAEAEELYETALARLAPDSLRLPRAWVGTVAGLGTALQEQGRYDDAERRYRHALTAAERWWPDDFDDLAGRLSNLGNALLRQGRGDEAEAAMRRAVELQRQGTGPDHPRVATRLRSLGFVLSQTGNLEEGAAAEREALDIYRARLPSPHPRIATSLNNLGLTLIRSGNLEAGEELLREGLTMSRELHGDGSRQVAMSLINLAAVVDNQGRGEEALPLKREARDRLVEAVGAAHPFVAVAENNLGTGLHRLGRHEEATAHFDAAHRIRAAALGPSNELTIDALVKAAQCFIDHGDGGEGEARLAAAREALDPVAADLPELVEAVEEQAARLAGGG